VFRRVSNNSEPWLYVNSIDIAEGINDQHKGYVIPWAHKRAFYWLEKLRNWQEKYNPISVPTSWRDLEAPRLGRQLLGSRVDLDGRRESCFLFRNAAGSDSCRDKPITSGAIDQLWHLLMAKSETCFAVGGDGRGSRYPLGGLRASLVSALFFAGSKNTYPNTCSAPRRFQSQQSRS
jgi:hypothetical protein